MYMLETYSAVSKLSQSFRTNRAKALVPFRYLSFQYGRYLFRQVCPVNYQRSETFSKLSRRIRPKLYQALRNFQSFSRAFVSYSSRTSRSYFRTIKTSVPFLYLSTEYSRTFHRPPFASGIFSYLRGVATLLQRFP
jgi:hypothetical protein